MTLAKTHSPSMEADMNKSSSVVRRKREELSRKLDHSNKVVGARAKAEVPERGWRREGVEGRTFCVQREVDRVERIRCKEFRFQRSEGGEEDEVVLDDVMQGFDLEVRQGRSDVWKRERARGDLINSRRRKL